VTFNLCHSTDPDPNDVIKYRYDFGDGAVFQGNCRARHTYTYPPGPSNALAAACVTDGIPKHEACCQFAIKVRNACANDARPPTVSLTATAGPPIVLNARASDNVGVTAVEFIANAGCESRDILIGVDREAPYSVEWRNPHECGSYCVRAKAHDACGNAAFSDFVDVEVPCSDGPARLAESAGPGVFLSSDLKLADGRGHVSVNGRAVLPAATGREAGAQVPAVKGDNLVEALVVDGKGGGGTWRFELSGEAIAGSLLVEAGDVLQVAGRVVVFRLAGKPGERVAFRFAAKR
jgi:hypothetical protein